MSTDTFNNQEHLRVKDFLKLFQADSDIKLFLHEVKKEKSIQVKGLAGSFDAILATIAYLKNRRTNLFVLHDYEEAVYFQNDLQSLLPHQEIHLLPSSYRKPYSFTEVENANVLQRAEILSILNQKKEEGELIVTYPEALTEKVINQRSLLENTYTVKKGEDLDLSFISELLIEYDFEKTDFVYEAGQFAVRGGIIDVFSYAHDMPFRIELFGDEVDGIRTFDPITQLSVEEKEVAPIVPDVQTKLIQEIRESFLRFIPQDTKIWFKDYQLTIDTIDSYFQKATEEFQDILSKNNNTKIINDPEELYESVANFEKFAEELTRIEFGKKFSLETKSVVKFELHPQPSFNKDFDYLSDQLTEKKHEGKDIVITSDLPKQIERLENIFAEINPDLRFQSINISLREGFEMVNTPLLCYTDHQIFERFHKAKGKKKYSKSKAMTLKELRELKIGDYVVHADHGIARFTGLEKQIHNDKEQEAIRLIFRDNDMMYVSLHALHKISKYSGQDGVEPKISKLGSVEWENKKKKVKKKVKDIASDLIKLYAKRVKSHGYAYQPDSYLQAELESSFFYEDTPDQAKATGEVKSDMEQPYPMDRLVCGDVGFGKTEVAIRAAFKAVCDSKQVAVMVPTTILALQHYKTFKARMENLPCRVEYVNRFRTAKQIREVLKDLKEGKVDILIGTHRIASKDVQFRDLGLLVIDEEQKFGVKTKEKIKEMKINVDVLTLTATPIPRTLHFSLLGARDLSVISTPPPNRQPVTTEIHTFTDEVLRDAISFELKRGGQAFFVHNRINDLEKIANRILSLVPDAKVCYAHGQMDGPQLEKMMLRFIEGEYDVLVSTNIIESGLDIPNANTILVNQAHMFGLSDLHQMRGRVGRSNRKAYCYFLTPPTINLTGDARKRLSALEEFSDLGDGFKVAMRDLDIRGAGNLLGGEQSGFISDLGFEMYNKVLEEAVDELKENEFQDLFSKEISKKTIKVSCSIETDFEILIPDEYVSNISERLNLYITADKLKNEETLEKFNQSLKDRFGPLPTAVKDLLLTVRLRWSAEKLAFEKLILKNGNLKVYLLEHTHAHYYQSEEFGKVLAFVQKYPRKCSLKETKKRLILNIADIPSIENALNCLAEINQV
ncbi:transcription-repair coupling factor [Sediminitomix flava]|uniref:Transcription-repair-coupling factor n=1 Tax=Sediminitomix flava TaxID=379075 RepID=A0A315Z6Y8_SEDFL|nr:transcription-repair coupling factor [Sediminitomix flava]PWJ39301.1 transcription-repair coupling factor (superfamily II helicase) [Sediminitomix flava]